MHPPAVCVTIGASKYSKPETLRIIAKELHVHPAS
jgi:hypothetical protein